MKLLVVLVAVVLLGGFGAVRALPSEGERAARERAVKLFDAMETYAGTTALDQAREARRYGGVRIVVARETPAGREIVLAVRAVREPSNTADWFPAEPYDVTRCFRWTEDRAAGEAGAVECPPRDVDPRTAPTPAPVPDDADELVARVLAEGGGVLATREALAGLDAEVARVDGVLAVAVQGVAGYASGRRINECLLGMRVRGEVAVWRSSKIQVAPGEAGCYPESAAMPALQAPPH